MPCRPLRLLHAADFHLERPLHGLAAPPESLRESLLEAPHQAAARVFDAAIAENVDLVVLAGDVAAPQLAGPRALVFLSDQFARLEQHEIAVYWGTGQADAASLWPARIEFPENVHLFPAGHTQEIVHQKGGEPLARIVGTSFQRGSTVAVGDFRPDPDGLATIGVAYGGVTPETLKKQRIGYLALGGRHDRFTCSTGAHGAHYPGTPQGRRPEETGPHGCTIVHIDETGRTRTRFVATDVMRWVRERVVVEQSTSASTLEELLSARIESLRQRVGDVDLLIEWEAVGPGLAGLPTPQQRASEAILAGLRRRWDDKTPRVWSESLRLHPPYQRTPADDDSIAADLAHLVREYEQDPERPLELPSEASDPAVASVLKSAARLDSTGQRHEVLSEIARLGADLLAPQQPRREIHQEVQS